MNIVKPQRQAGYWIFDTDDGAVYIDRGFDTEVEAKRVRDDLLKHSLPTNRWHERLVVRFHDPFAPEPRAAIRKPRPSCIPKKAKLPVEPPGEVMITCRECGRAGLPCHPCSAGKPKPCTCCARCVELCP